jgi:hypothetical protein
VRQLFATNYGQSIDSPLDLIGTSTPDNLNKHLMKALDDPVQCIVGPKELLLGPSWMIEGSAEVFE